MEKFLITKDYTTNIKKFNFRGRKIEFKLKTPPKNYDPMKWIEESVEQIVQKSVDGLQPDDLVGFTFCDKSLNERGPGWINYKPASSVKMSDIWDMISKIFQSNSEGLSTDSFCLNVTTVRLPAGRGSRRNKYATYDEECIKRKGIVYIKNTDNNCLPRSLVVAIAFCTKDCNFKQIRQSTKLQTQKMLELLEDSKIKIPESGAGIKELQQFQNHLQNYNITVYQYGSKGREIIYNGHNEANFKINLLYNNQHYSVITSLTAAFCCSYYCELCHTPYNAKNDHRCGGSCPCCQQSPVCIKTEEILCESCNRSFRGEICFNNHSQFKICDHVKRCNDCLKVIKRDRIHMCGEIFCKICKSHQPSGHLCFIQKDDRTPIEKDFSFIFYDLETRQEKLLKQETKNDHLLEIKQHEPNLCVYQQRCHICLEDDSLCFCQICGFRTQIIKENVIKNFMDHILNTSKKFKKIIVIAHNGQAFDHQFLLNYILNKTDQLPNLIMRGTKIILMEILNIKFIDSLNYFPMPLKSLPKAFDLNSIYKKGYFPHLFNTEANSAYIGKLPSLEYYAPHTMKGDDDDNNDERKQFLCWYNDNKENTFDMQKEIEEYCKSDVKILAESCLKFRSMFKKECNVDPFIEAVTIASACNLTFRRNFLKSNTIGIIPKNGYRWCENQSEIAIQWLIWEESQRNINIINAAKQTEAQIKGVKVDGYCEATKQVFEFHGCFYHGHPTCFKYNRDKSLNDDPNDTLNNRYEHTLAKTKRLRSFGYEVIEMWECEFKMTLNKLNNTSVLENHPLVKIAPLDPRDAFYGGRTGNTKSYYKCKPGEKIKYIDVCSLYPWVCKNGKFPVGHPKIHLLEDCSTLNLKDMNGLIKCCILPPQNLYHPILPVKMNNKLMFLLCRSCGIQKEKEECNHVEHERALTGTWVIDEVQKALECGYILLETYEIWEYNIEQYDKTTKLGGLFTSMMNKFLKIKQQASGWPSTCETDEEKLQYISEFLNNEGIYLDFNDIIKNAGLRSLAKLMLNSFWGKFGQRENQPKTSIINKPEELYFILTDPSVIVNHILPINESTLIVNWENTDDGMYPLHTVNVCIAAYTTTQARLKLYSYLERLGRRVLYYDTDSVIYISKDNEYEPLTGEFIGDMTDELEGEYGQGSYITEFVSGGPKNYAFNVFNPTKNKYFTKCKVKGISLNYQNAKLINLKTIKSMVLNENDEKHINVLTSVIRRTTDYNVVTSSERKIYRPLSEKRRFLNDYDSIPYGYKKIKLT